jgi:hypothetical protein
MLLGLLPLAKAAVQLAEAEVTMGGEWAHPELIGPDESLAVVRLGRLLIRRLRLRADLAEKAENPGLVAALLLPAAEVKGAPGNFERVLSGPASRCASPR